MSSNSRPTEEKRPKSALQITLIDADQTIKSLWLPQKIEGKFRFPGNEPDEWYNFFYLEGDGESWYAVCTAEAYIKAGSGEAKGRAALSNGQFLTIRHDDREYILY